MLEYPPEEVRGGIGSSDVVAFNHEKKEKHLIDNNHKEAKRMFKKISSVRIASVVIVMAVIGALMVWAYAFNTGALVQVSFTSPFGAQDACGNFPGTIPETGTLFVDSEVEPWVVVNPTDSDNIVAFWQQDRWSNGGARSNVAGVSIDGGAAWDPVVVPGLTVCSGGDFERASDPWLSFAPDGTLHQMSLVFDIDPPQNRPGGFGRNGMMVSKSTDGGETWSEPILLVDESNPRFLHDKNSLTADPTDANFVYAVWDRLQLSAGDTIDPENLAPVPPPAFGVRFGFGFKGPIYFARSTDGGDTWEQARPIYDPGANDQTIGNQIVVLPDGTVIDFFTELLNVENSDQEGPGFNYDLALLRSPDKGETWLPRGKPIRFARIFTSFGAVTPDDEVPVRDGNRLFDVAVDPDNGNLYVVWQDTRFRGVEEVAFSMSTDGGFTWSEPIRINQTPADTANPLRQQAFLPSVEVADGIVGVTYYDFRNDENDETSGELADHWFVYCENNCSNPASWMGNELRLTDSSFDYLEAPFARGLFLGDYVGLASDGTDFLAFFQQSFASDPASGFFRRISP